MCHRNLGGLGFRREFYGDARDLAGWAQGKGVLQQPGRLGLEHLAANIANRFAIGSGADPIHGTARLQIDFQFGPHKEDTIGFRRDEAIPHLVRRCSDIEDEVQWTLLGHQVSFSVTILEEHNHSRIFEGSSPLRPKIPFLSR
jgi:hypothetical protein